MSSYIGKQVELRTVQGAYRGTVIEVTSDQKVMLKNVEFIDAEGKVVLLQRIRIAKNDLIDKEVKLLGESSNSSLNGGPDPIALYNQAASDNSQSLRNVRRNGANSLRQSHNREYSQTDWAADVNNVFPPNNVFLLELEQHQTQFIRVAAVRDMRDFPNYCVLANPDDKEFAEAVRIISSPSVANVGLSVLGSPLCRTTRPAWIAVSTPRGIFIFDIRFMSNVTMEACGLAKFLSSQSDSLPRKIMHDSRFAADALKHSYNINLSIYCDTLALKTCLFMRDSNGKVPRNAWSLFDLLHEYMPVGKDLDLLEHRFNFAQYEYEHEIWNCRPAKEAVIHLAAAVTVHLCELYECLVVALMEPIHNATAILLNSVRNSSSAPFTTKATQLRLPDSLAEMAPATSSPGQQSQYINNDVMAGVRRPDIQYKKGLMRCGMGSFIAVTTSTYGGV